MLKKSVIASLILSASGIASAGSFSCTPGSVTVPCESRAWDIGISALYLQSLYSGDPYFAQNITANRTNYRDFNPRWGFGFKLEGSYHWGTGNDFNINWTHFDKKTTRSGFDPEFQTDATYSEKHKFDAVNFEFGQHVDFGEVIDVRMHGGFQYARIEVSPRGIDSATNGAIISGGGYGKFNGFGIRAGADGSYDFGNGFSAILNAAGGILVGDSKLQRSVTILGNTTTLSASRRAIIPMLETKAGVKYSHAMEQGNLSVEGGYQIANYFNALQNAAPGADVNFGLHGAYLTLKWVGNA